MREMEVGERSWGGGDTGGCGGGSGKVVWVVLLVCVCMNVTIIFARERELNGA